MVDIDELRGELVGRQLADGRYTVRDYEAWLTADVVQVDPAGRAAIAGGDAHPIFLLLAGMLGVSFPIEYLWELVRCAPEDGPMIGETDMQQVRPIRIGEEIRVTTTIVDLVRKSGSTGIFDVMTVEHLLLDAGGAQIGSLVDSLIYPRPERS